MERVNIIILTLAIVSFTCYSNNFQQTQQDLIQKDGEMVSVKGIYSKCFLGQQKSDQHYGRYKIVVSDKLEINLLQPYNPASIRPVEEVRVMEGKLVQATGRISQRTFIESPILDHEPLSVSIPCFETIERIAPVERD